MLACIDALKDESSRVLLIVRGAIFLLSRGMLRALGCHNIWKVVLANPQTFHCLLRHLIVLQVRPRALPEAALFGSLAFWRGSSVTSRDLSKSSTTCDELTDR